MEDTEFDKLFADKMRRAGAPDLSDEDWGHLSPLLEAEQRRRWRAFPLWWLGALSAILLCSNLGWWWLWRQTETDSDTLRTEWKQLRKESVTLRDTIWTKVVVSQYDTVYKTIIYSTPSQSAFQNTGLVFNQGNLEQSIIGHDKTLDENTQSGEFLTKAVPEILATDVEEQSLKEEDYAPINLDVLPIKSGALKMPAKDFLLAEKEPRVISPKRVRTPWAPMLIPRKVRLGAGVGYVTAEAQNLVSRGGYSSFLTSEFVFSDQLAFTLEGAYRAVKFKGTVYDESLGLPSHTSPGDDYVFEYFEPEEGGLKTIWQLTAGMRYWFRPKHRLSPYLGLGYGMQWQSPLELKLEYHNTVTDKEKESSVEVPFLSTPVSLLDLNAGLRYQFLRNLYWQTGGSYQFKMDGSQPGIPRFWELKASVLYGF